MGRLRQLLTVGRWIMVALAWLPVLALYSVLPETGRGLDWAQVLLLLSPSAVLAWFWMSIAGTQGVLRPAVAVVAYVGLSLAVYIVVPHPPLLSIGNWFVFAAILIGAGFEWRTAVAALTALLVLQIPIDLREPPQEAMTALSADALNTAFVGASAIGARLLVTAYIQLLAARDEIARLAVADERLRFARDLHDLLGQSLTTVALKSEVVARRLPPEADAMLEREVRDVAEVARHTLDEVREAVAGYRQASVDRELANALVSLRTAGISASLDNRAGPLSPDEEAVLSWALREALTNVLKHSGARECRVILRRVGDRVVLEVADDGRGGHGPVRLGHGLRGIQERARALGGTSSAEASADGFRTIVELPAG